MRKGLALVGRLLTLSQGGAEGQLDGARVFMRLKSP